MNFTAANIASYLSAGRQECRRQKFNSTFGFLLYFSILSKILRLHSTQNFSKMTETQIHDIIKYVEATFDKMTECSERAQSDLFLSYYDNSPTFLHFSGDGKMRNFDEFKKICYEYYDALKQQKISTITKKINVIDANLAVLGWTGNIVAQFKGGDIMKMNNYSITSVFKRIDDKWKIIHAHESSLPPEVIKER